MEKNVCVIDGSGRIIGTTYPKRAKGLVKSGRARYVSCESKDTICLTCPPDKMEDNKMTDNSFDITFAETCDNAAEGEVSIETAGETPTPSVEYALQMLEAIALDKEAIMTAVSNASPATIEFVYQMIDAREKTNRELIAFYTQMYNDHKPVAPAKKSNTVTRFEEIATMLKNMKRDDYDEEAWETLMDAAETQLTRNY